MILNRPQFSPGGGGSGPMPMNPKMTPSAVSMPNNPPRLMTSGLGSPTKMDPIGPVSKNVFSGSSSNPVTVQSNKKVM
jgi:hypothetical protein